MEDTDKEDISKESLDKQFKIVKKETNTSHVQEFGDMSIGKMSVSEFQGKAQPPKIFYPPVNFSGFLHDCAGFLHFMNIISFLGT